MQEEISSDRERCLWLVWFLLNHGQRSQNMLDFYLTQNSNEAERPVL